MIIKTSFTNNGVPQEGLSPLIRIINLPGQQVEVSGASMTENIELTGSYYYSFAAYSPTGNYDIRCDGGVALSNYDRYTWAVNSDDLEIASEWSGISGAVAASKVDLDNPTQYMAVITGLSLDGEYDSVISGIQAEVDKPTNFMANVTGINDLSGYIAPIIVDLNNPSQYMANVTGINDLSGYSVLTDVEITKVSGAVVDILEDTSITIPGTITTMQTDLDNPTQYMSNVTGINDLSGYIAPIQVETTAIKAVTDNFPADMSGEMAIIQGLLHSNIYTVLGWDGDNMTGGLIKLYDNKANTITHGAGGLLATFSVTGIYSAGKAQTILMVRES